MYMKTPVIIIKCQRDNKTLNINDETRVGQRNFMRSNHRIGRKRTLHTKHYTSVELQVRNSLFIPRLSC
jgi:hypothetical protein